MQTAVNDYLSIINPNAVAFDVPAANKDEAFTYAASLLKKDGVITSVEDFKKDLYAREAMGETGIGGGVAIPHGKSEAVLRTCISVIRLKEPIAWETPDEQPVQLLILFAVSMADKNNYFLRMMAQIARKLAHEGVCQQLIAAKNMDELMQCLS